MSETADLAAQLRALRLRGDLQGARALIAAQPGFGTSAELSRLHHEHADFWWQPLVGRRVTLKRRNAGDAAFVRRCWADTAFMRKFNRLARPLPADEAQLHGILARECAGLVSEARALHWTVHTRNGPIGFVSVTDILAGHRRAEFLIGLLRQPPGQVSVEATDLALDFLRDRAGIERLTAYFYAENAYAAQVAQKYGFEREGVLKGYIRDADGSRSDLIVAGLLLATHRARLRRREAG